MLGMLILRDGSHGAIADINTKGGIMIWSVDFDDATGGGIGLDNPNRFRSPESATIIPMAHTTVPAGQTFTIGSRAATDISRLNNDGDQNTPRGPGADKCAQCSFFRLLTSTCCGTGGSTGNPIIISAGVSTPMDIPLPAGFKPGQSFQDIDGNNVPANEPLPRETIIPRGTTFDQPFVIDPAIQLREGEGDDQSSNSSSLIWLSPDIWDSPNPQVQCFFPCTLVLPPWPSHTTTVEYPRITVTEGNTVKTTLTFPPITVSRWEPSTIIIDGSPYCTTSCTSDDRDDKKRTSAVELRKTTVWPPVTYTTDGTVKTTRPHETDGPGGTRPSDSDPTNLPADSDPADPKPDPDPEDPPGDGENPCKWPDCPPAPPRLPIPSLTIRWGPPEPTVEPCAYPALSCLTPGNRPIPPFGPNDPDDPDDEEEEENEESLVCKADFDEIEEGRNEPDPWTTTTTVTPPAGTTTIIKTIFTTPPVSQAKTTTTTTVLKEPRPSPKSPDFSKDEIKCYDSGQVGNRVHLIKPVDSWCKSMKGKKLESKYFSSVLSTSFPCCNTRDEVIPIKIDWSVEVHEGCEWNVDVDTCKAEFRKIIDGCDRNTEHRKQGGRLIGNCMTWRVDPNAQ